jgi:hypothetical protein
MRTLQGAKFACLLLAAMLPVAVQGQFTYTNNADGVTITITGYTGSGTAVTIPSTLDGFLVTGIGDSAFYNDTSAL